MAGVSEVVVSIQPLIANDHIQSSYRYIPLQGPLGPLILRLGDKRYC